MKTLTVLLAISFVAAGLARADDDNDVDSVALARTNVEPAAQNNMSKSKTRYGPMDTELRLSDGSILRGELKHCDSVRLKTAYGLLTIPSAHLLSLSRGQRLTTEEIKAVDAILKQLDADGFSQRGVAQQKLEEMGPPIVSALKTARGTASLEARNRIDTVLKKIEAKGLPPVQMDDIVRADDLVAPGRVDMESVVLKTKFGEITVKFEDIQSLRWLNRGSCNTLDLECADGLEDWRDTGIEGVPGAPLAVQCSGHVNISGTPCDPPGNPNWGNGHPFMTGSVVGRIGTGGQPFLIGNGKRLTMDSSEHLYVKIFWPQRNFQRQDNQYTGHYTIKIGTGSWADEFQSSNN